MRMRSALSLTLGVSLAFASLTLPAAAASGDIPLIENGEVRTIIVVPDDPAERVTAAADILAATLAEVSDSAAPPINTVSTLAQASPAPSITRIMLGVHTETNSVIEQELTGLSRDGWILRAHPGDAANPSTIEILAPSPDGIWAGTLAFMERELDATWLMPWDFGDYVAKAQNLNVPGTHLRFEPAFSMGELFMIGDLPWINQMAMHATDDPGYKFSHYLWRIFAGGIYGDSNPEYYPVVGGVRRIPGKNGVPGHYDWNPRFTDETADVAVDYILEHFQNNPDDEWFSLGVNDNNGFDDEYTSNAVPNSLGVKGVSDVYFTWVNEIVRRVTADGTRFQDKKFGVIAYSALADPPNFDLHPQVIPFLTKDVGIWIDATVRDRDRQWIDGWKAVASAVGWYDYTYGSYYAIPRIYPHLMADSYAYLESVNVKGYFAEWSPGWGEGPKAYIQAKLSRDPSLDVDVLLSEWAVRAVGADASVPLIQYYEHWEEFWTSRVIATEWFQASKRGIYMNVHTSSYLDAVTADDITLTRDLMSQVTALATTPDEQARAAVLSRAADIYIASMASYPKSTVTVSSAQEALAWLADDGGVAEAIEQAALRNRLLDAEMARADSHLDDDPRNFGVGNVWNGVNPHLQTRMVEFLHAEEPSGGTVTERLRDIAISSQDTLLRSFARDVLLRTVPATNRVQDPSFEELSGGLTASGTWYAQALTPGGGFEVTQDAARTGSKSLLATDVAFSAVSQVIPVSAGNGGAAVRFSTPENTSSGATMWFKATLLAGDGTILTANHAFTDTLSAASGAGTWAEARLQFDVPAAVGGVPVTDILLQLEVYQQADGIPLYVDDFEFTQTVALDTSRLDSVKSAYQRILDTALGDRYTESSVADLRSAYDAVITASRMFGITTQVEFDDLVAAAQSAFNSLEARPSTIENRIWLSDVDYDAARSWAPQPGTTEGIRLDLNAAGAPFSVLTGSGIEQIEKAVGATSPSEIIYDLSGLGINTFSALMALDQGASVPRLFSKSVPLPAADTRFATDMTEFTRTHGQDGLVSFLLSTVESGGSYLGDKHLPPTHAPALILTLSDGTQVSVPASETVDVRSWMPDQNLDAIDMGQMQQLGGAGNGTAKSYMQFAIPAEVDFGQLDKAELDMWFAAGTMGASSIIVSGLTVDDWEADVITFATQPQAYTEADVATLPPVDFEVFGDGELLAAGSASPLEPVSPVAVALDRISELKLVIKPSENPFSSSAVWANAQLYSVVPIVPEPTTPTIALGTTSVPAGSEITVTGTGFVSAAEIVLELRSNTVPLGTVTADADGDFTATVLIPATTPTGIHAVVAVLADGAEVSTQLLVTAAGSSSNGGGGGGGDLAVTGADSTPYITIALVLLALGLSLVAIRRRSQSRL